MDSPQRTVFLSYCSQDREAAGRLAEALRAAGLQVWFDRSSLRSGDAWDASIRGVIRECGLFVPVISAHTQAREEGYFRREWNLAVTRMLDMTDRKPFLLPVLLDGVSEADALVPDKFRERQWSSIGDAGQLAAFAERAAALLGEGDAPSAAAGASARGPDQASGANRPPSIAVLAFSNRSASAEDEFFADGLADELINTLARVQGLRVAARTSAFSFKGKPATIAEVGRLLDVSTVLEGSVRRSGSRVRVSLQLVQVAGGHQLWAQSYDRTLEDILAVQDDIAAAVIRELRAVLTDTGSGGREAVDPPAATPRSAVVSAETARAHALFLHGRYLVRRLAVADIEQGTEFLRRALRIDPAYAPAWAWLSLALTLGAGYEQLPGEAVSEARSAAEQALGLDPNCVAGQVAVVTFESMWGWNWARAQEVVDDALRLAPGDLDLCTAASRFFDCVGQTQRALELAQAAVTLDPLSSRTYASLARALHFAGRPPSEVEAAVRKSIDLSPQRMTSSFMLAWALLGQGKFRQAREVVETARPSLRLTIDAIAHHQAGAAKRADQALAQLTSMEGSRGEGTSNAFLIAMIHAARGDADSAFGWLDAAFASRDPGLMFVAVEPELRPLRGDPRWTLLMRRMGLPAA